MAVIDRGKVTVFYPDFDLPEYGVIIEYSGINGEAGYEEGKRHKMEVYRKNGIEGLFLTEKSFKGEWPKKIISQIEDILKNGLQSFYNR